MKKPKIKPIHKIYSEYGIHVILHQLGVEQTETESKRYDFFYLSQCKRCGKIRKIPQRSMNLSKGKPRYCSCCPPLKVIEARKEKIAEYEKKQKDYEALNEKNSGLYRLAIFGK